MDNIKERNIIYYNQALLLLINLRVMVALTSLPILLVSPANQDVWAALLLSIPYTMILSLPLLFLSNKFNNLNLLEIMEKIMGKVLGKIIGALYFLGFIYYIILFSSIFAEILDSALFRDTPTWATASVLLITCSYMAHKGLRNLARFGETVIPIILLIIFVFVILGYDNYQFSNLLPMFRDSTFREINIGAISVSLRFVNIVFATMITPYLKNKKDLNKVYFRSIVYSILIVIVIVITVQIALGIEFAKRIISPFFTYTRLLNFGQVIQGFELFYIVIWIIGNIVRISGYLYFSSVSLGQITGIRNDRFIIPISIVTLIAIQLIKGRRPILGVGEPLDQIIFIIPLISILVIPLVALIVFFFRRKKL